MELETNKYKIYYYLNNLWSKKHYGVIPVSTYLNDEKNFIDKQNLTDKQNFQDTTIFQDTSNILKEYEDYFYLNQTFL